MNQSSPIFDVSGDPRRLRVLLVDDHELGRRSLSRLLEATGYEVQSAKDGRSAIAILNTEIAPDFVLTDVRLPDVDGREVVQAARHLVPRPWIALITGWDLDADEPGRLGIDSVFLKPLNISEIIAKLQEARGSSVEVCDRIANLDEDGRSSP